MLNNFFTVNDISFKETNCDRNEIKNPSEDFDSVIPGTPDNQRNLSSISSMMLKLRKSQQQNRVSKV